MDEKTFDLVDGIIGGLGYHDDRGAAMDLLQSGVENGTLQDTAQVVASRYALQPKSVIEWFAETLIRQIQDIAGTIVKLEEMQKENVRS